MVEATHTLGIMGGGQLGGMLAQAANELNLTSIVLDPGGDECSAKKIAGAAVIKGGWHDRERILDLAQAAQYLTLEVEEINARMLQIAAWEYSRAMNPSPETILNIRDKYRQHQIFASLGIPVAPHREVFSAGDIREELDQSPTGLIAKLKRGGYDGRGNAGINSEADIETAMARLQNGDPAKQLYVEHRIPFAKEVAMMVAIGSSGEIKLYPLAETKHLRGQLREVIAPAQVSETARLRAGSIVTRLAESFFQGAGVFGVEMFLCQDDQILANESAPRVHNSGHFSIEACITSQFTNHVLAVTGQPLGASDMLYPYAGMVNGIGDYRGLAEVSRMDGAFIHDYQKKPTLEKPERKLYHVTILGEDYEEFINRMQKISSLLTR